MRLSKFTSIFFFIPFLSALCFAESAEDFSIQVSHWDIPDSKYFPDVPYPCVYFHNTSRYDGPYSGAATFAVHMIIEDNNGVQLTDAWIDRIEFEYDEIKYSCIALAGKIPSAGTYVFRVEVLSPSKDHTFLKDSEYFSIHQCDATISTSVVVEKTVQIEWDESYKSEPIVTTATVSEECQCDIDSIKYYIDNKFYSSIEKSRIYSDPYKFTKDCQLLVEVYSNKYCENSTPISKKYSIDVVKQTPPNPVLETNSITFPDVIEGQYISKDTTVLLTNTGEGKLQNISVTSDVPWITLTINKTVLNQNESATITLTTVTSELEKLSVGSKTGTVSVVTSTGNMNISILILKKVSFIGDLSINSFEIINEIDYQINPGDLLLFHLVIDGKNRRENDMIKIEFNNLLSFSTNGNLLKTKDFVIDKDICEIEFDVKVNLFKINEEYSYQNYPFIDVIDEFHDVDFLNGKKTINISDCMSMVISNTLYNYKKQIKDVNVYINKNNAAISYPKRVNEILSNSYYGISGGVYDFHTSVSQISYGEMMRLQALKAAVFNRVKADKPNNLFMPDDNLSILSNVDKYVYALLSPVGSKEEPVHPLYVFEELINNKSLTLYPNNESWESAVPSERKSHLDNINSNITNLFTTQHPEINYENCLYNQGHPCIEMAYFMSSLVRLLGFPTREINCIYTKKSNFFQNAMVQCFYDNSWHLYDPHYTFSKSSNNQAVVVNVNVHSIWSAVDRPIQPPGKYLSYLISGQHHHIFEFDIHTYKPKYPSGWYIESNSNDHVQIEVNREFNAQLSSVVKVYTTDSFGYFNTDFIFKDSICILPAGDSVFTSNRSFNVNTVINNDLLIVPKNCLKSSTVFNIPDNTKSLVFYFNRDTTFIINNVIVNDRSSAYLFYDERIDTLICENDKTKLLKNGVANIDKIYVKGNLIIFQDGNSLSEPNIYIYDILGKKKKVVNIIKSSNSCNAKLNFLHSGKYFIRYKNELIPILIAR